MERFQAYDGRYSSFNIPKKLINYFGSDKNVQGQVLSFCVAQAKSNGHHLLYEQLINEAKAKGLKLESCADYDPDWFKATNTKFEQDRANLDSELKSHQASNITPSIQASCLELAKLMINAGNYRDFEQYILSGRNLQSANLDIDFFYKVILFQSEQYDALRTFIRDNENNEQFLTMAIEQKSVFANHRAMFGITELRARNYDAALTALSEVNADDIEYIGLYSSLGDLARYIAVLGLFKYTRAEIKPKLLAGNARGVLGNNIDALRLVESYVDADYEVFSTSLEKVMNEWQADSLVESSRKQCYEGILEKAIRQYLSTVQRVQITTIANTFRVLPNICFEICKILILTNQIPFKIDKVNEVLVCKEKDRFTPDELAKKASKLVGNYSFDKQYAVLKVAFSNIHNSRKGKGMYDQFE